MSRNGLHFVFWNGKACEWWPGIFSFLPLARWWSRLTCNVQWRDHPECLDGGSSHYEHDDETRARHWKMDWNGTAIQYNGTVSLFFPRHAACWKRNSALKSDTNGGKITSYFAHTDSSDHEVGQLLLVFYSDADATVDFFAIFACRPILDAHDLKSQTKAFLEKSSLTRLCGFRTTFWKCFHACFCSHSYPNEVESSGNHDYAWGSFLPDHSPKVSNGRFCRSLSHNICFGLNQALEKMRKHTISSRYFLS